MKRLTILLLLISNIVVCQDTINYKHDEISDYFEIVKKQYNLPGLVVAITNENNIEYTESFGKVSKDGRFLIGSNSKGFTALLVLKLQEKGLLNINDPVVKYLDWFEYENKQVSDKITLKDLLHHTSGLSKQLGQYFPHKDEENVKLSLTEKLKNVSGDTYPITDFKYSNINYNLLGYVIEQVSNKDYTEALKSEITEPLGMLSTSTSITDNIVQGYQHFLYYPIIRKTLNYHTEDIPAAYINSNAVDLSKYLRSLMNSYNGNSNSIINKKVTNTLFKPNKLNNFQYELGWYVAKYNGFEIFAHDGAIEGFQSAMVIVPEMRKGIIVMTNCYNGVTHIPHEISVGILNILAGKKPEKQSKILFYSIRTLPILALVLTIILFFVLKRWIRLHKPLKMTKKIMPNLLLLLGVIIGLGWIILVPNFFDANLRNALDFDISSGLSLILLSVLTIALSFIMYFNQNSKPLPNTQYKTVGSSDFEAFSFRASVFLSGKERTLEKPTALYCKTVTTIIE